MKTYKIINIKTNELILKYTVYDKKLDKLLKLQFKKIKGTNLVEVNDEEKGR